MTRPPARARMWCVMRDDKIYLAWPTRKGAAANAKILRLDGQSKHKWRVVSVDVIERGRKR